MKLRSLRIGLPAVHEFGELPPKLEFDKFDDHIAADGGEPETEDLDRQPPEGTNDSRTDENGEEGEESEPKPRTKPPAADEYQWQWKVYDLGSNPILQYTDQVSQPKLETSRRTFFL